MKAILRWRIGVLEEHYWCSVPIACWDLKRKFESIWVLGPMVAFKKGKMARTFTFIRVSTPRPELT